MTALPANVAKPILSPLTADRVEIAERALLGRLLILGERGKASGDYERVADLTKSDFVKTFHGAIWEAMKALATRQDNINVTTVEHELAKGLGRAITGEASAYLESLLKGRPGDVEDSAKIIRKASWKRRFKATVRDLDKMADDDNLTEDQIVGKTAEQVERIIQQSIALTGKTGISLHESINILHDRVQIGMQSRQSSGEILYYGIMSGLHAIDEVTQGFQRGEVTVIAGSTGTGKSAMAIKIGKTAMQNNHRVCFVPLEMTHLNMTQRLMAIETRISGTAIKNADIPNEAYPRFQEACKRIQGYEMSHQFTYLDIDPRPNIHQLKAKLIAHINLYSPEIVIVDQVSIEAMSGTKPNMHENEIIREIMPELKALAEKYLIHFIVIAQLNRGGSGHDGQRPTLNNLASSSSVEKSAQIVILLYRESNQEQKAIEPVEVIFAKNRDGWKGTKYASFIPALTDYVDV